MRRRLIPSVMVAALLSGQFAASALRAVASDSTSQFPWGAASAGDVPSALDEYPLLTPEVAFGEDGQERPLMGSSFPLLRISPGKPAAGSNGFHRATSREPAQGPEDESAPSESGSLSAGSKGRSTTNAEGGVVPFTGLQKLKDAPSHDLANLPRLMLMTILVLGTCLGTLVFGRRWLMRAGLVQHANRNTRLQIVASLSISPRSQLHVVRYDDREVLVGIDARGLQQIQIVGPSFNTLLHDEPEPFGITGDQEAKPRSRAPVSRLFATV